MPTALAISGQDELIVLGATVVAVIALGGALLQGSSSKFRTSAAIIGGWFLVTALAGLGDPADMLLLGTTVVVLILGFGAVANPWPTSQKCFHVAAYVGVWFLVAALTERAH